jgi:hypothetical protein
MAKKQDIVVPDFNVEGLTQEETQQQTAPKPASEKPKTKAAPKAAKADDKPKGPNPFEKFIKAYLDKKAANDEVFAQTYKKPKKSIERCCAYIITQMAKKAFEVKGQGRMAICCGMDADLDKSPVINYAIHYWDEDDLAIDKVSKEAVKQVTEQVQIDVPDMSSFDFNMF